MKKIFTFIILICICFVPNMVEAKPKYEFQWDNDNEFYLYLENDKFYFTDDEFDFGRVEEYDLNIYDKNGEFLKSEIFFDPSKMTRKELFKTKRYQALSRYDELWEQREYFFDDEVYVYSISYVYKEITAYNLDEDKAEIISFEDGTDLLKELMGNKYKILEKYNDKLEYIKHIYEFENTYVLTYLDTDNYEYRALVFDKNYDLIFRYNNGLNQRIYAVENEGLLYFTGVNGKIDVFKINGEKVSTITLEHDYFDYEKHDMCGRYVVVDMDFFNNEFIILYEYNPCDQRVNLTDANDFTNVTHIPYYITLKYSINYEVEKINSSNGDFTFENKIDEDGKSYVELKIEPKKGYSVKEIIVTDSNGNIIPVTSNKFYMPLNDVKVEVKYIEGEYLPIPNTSLSQNLSFILIGIILIGLGSYTMKFVKREEN